MENDVVQAAQMKMDKTLDVLKKELLALRAGRANPQLLDRIVVDYYGTPTPLNQLGNISAPEPRMLMISLWDMKILGEVEKAIQKSDLGINPSNDGKVIRLMIPELTEERRKELVKLTGRMCEEARVAIRAIRRDANEHIKKMIKSGDITEDDRKDLEEDVQKRTDAHIKTVDKMLAEKEKEILSV